MKNNFGNNLPIVNLYKKKSSKSLVDTQLLYGDNFKVLKKYGSWSKIKILKDNYNGYVKNWKFAKSIKPNFKVSVLKSNLFLAPNTKKKLKKCLPFNSRLKVTHRAGKFAKFDKFWVKFSDLKRNNYKQKNIFKNIKIYKNTKYLWGGKSYKGIDCSALVQIFFNYNNKFFPRDSKDQENFLNKRVDLKNIKKNDLIFWKGHVAIALSKKLLIHAYGPLKKVVIMDINKTMNRIKKTANLKVTSIRRP